MNRLHRSLIFSFIERYSVMALNIATIAIVARLLTPTEVGIFMVGSGVIMMIEAFRDFGVSVYLIQMKEITAEATRTAFTLTLIFSAAFAGCLALASGPVASFYGEPGLSAVLQVSALSFLLAPFSAPILALLRRDMRFGAVSIINISGTAANFVSFCVFALLGLGFMSLAWSSLVASLMIATLAISLRPQAGMFRPALSDWRKILKFGGFASATQLLNAFYQSLPQLILGRILTFDAVGLFNRATTVCQLPERFIISALQPVVLPALAEEVRAGRGLKAPYLRAIGLMTAMQWPFLLCLALLADPFVELLLGPQWAASAPLVRMLALASLVMFPAFLTYPVLVAVGQVKDTLLASLISLPPSILLVFITANIGIEAVAASTFVTAPFQIYVALRFVRRHVAFTWGEMAASTAKSAVVTLCTAVAPAAAIALAGFRFDLPVAAMFIAGAGAAIGWLVGLSITRHPLLDQVRLIAVHAMALVKSVRMTRWRGRPAAT